MTHRQPPGAARIAAACLGASLLAACAGAGVLPTDRFAPEPEAEKALADAPPGAAPGSCWGKDVTPAVIETVTDQVMVRPAEVLKDGTVRSQAVYRTETRQVIVSERREIRFETPCPDSLTVEFVSSLQRALAARGMLQANVTGVMDAPTRRAVRRYQRAQGLDSAILSLAAARSLGLVTVARSG